MPCVVFVKNSKNLMIVRSKWCQKINDAENRNFGSRPGEKMKIFFSSNRKAEPNFQLDAVDLDVFDENMAACACYHGYVLRNCGKASTCQFIVRSSLTSKLIGD